MGSWAPATPGANLAFQISRDGNAFSLVDNTNVKVPATYDPQTHVLNVSMGGVIVPFSYIAATDHLSALGDEFKRSTSDGPAAAAGNNTPTLDDQAVAFGKSLFTKDIITCNGRTLMELYSPGGQRADIPGEIKNPTFSVDPFNGNSAGKGDKLNGVDWKGSIDIHWEAFRYYYNHRWTDWFNGDGGDAPTEPSISTSESVVILHKNGQWVRDTSYGSETDFVGVRKKPLTCDAVPAS